MTARPETLGAMMEMLHGGAIKKRWWHRLPGLGPKLYTHTFKPDPRKFNAQLAAALKAGDEFKTAMDKVSAAVGASAPDHKKLLGQERFKYRSRRLMRAVRSGGTEIGWLGFNWPRWNFPWVKPGWRPYDWAIDGLPSKRKTVCDVMEVPESMVQVTEDTPG